MVVRDIKSRSATISGNRETAVTRKVENDGRCSLPVVGAAEGGGAMEHVGMTIEGTATGVMLAAWARNGTAHGDQPRQPTGVMAWATGGVEIGSAGVGGEVLRSLGCGVAARRVSLRIARRSVQSQGAWHRDDVVR